MKKGNRILGILRYSCLSCVFVFGLITITATGGGDADKKDPAENLPEELPEERPYMPNILLVLIDDVSPDMLSCYAPYTAKGFDLAAYTPNIDALAENGVMFKTCYATAMCTPTRAELLTGRYATRTGVIKNGVYIFENSSRYLEDHLSLGKILRDSGYSTAIAGKWNEGPIQPFSEEGGFEEYCLWSSINAMSRCDNFVGWDGGMEDENTTSRYWNPGLIMTGQKVVYTKEDDYGPDICSRFLIDFMERSVNNEKPFLAYWPCVAAHSARKGMPTNPLRGDVGDMSCDDVTENSARFSSLVEYIDLLMGRMLNKIEELGIADNAIIIFTSDNCTSGIGKTKGVEMGSHVVNIIAGAGVKARGASDELTDFSDIAPTLIEYSGGTIPDGYEFDGQSLVPFLTGETNSHREWIYGYIFTTQLLRTKEYLLEVVNPMMGLPEGRFCYTGPYRFRKGYIRAENIPEHQEARREMLKILEQFPPITEEHPYWQTPTGKEVYEENMTPNAINSHIHNDPEWSFYSEEDY